MILEYNTGEILCILIALGVFAFFAWLLTKKVPLFVRAPKIGAMAASIPAFIICFPLLQLVNYPLHVIDKFGQGKGYMLIGSSDYDFGNGIKGKVAFEWGKAHVVNQSDKDLVVDIVFYGMTSAAEQQENTYSIAAQSSGPVMHIDYYPNEIPPQQVESEGHSSKKYWLKVQP